MKNYKHQKGTEFTGIKTKHKVYSRLVAKEMQLVYVKDKDILQDNSHIRLCRLWQDGTVTGKVKIVKLRKEILVKLERGIWIPADPVYENEESFINYICGD